MRTAIPYYDLRRLDRGISISFPYPTPNWAISHNAGVVYEETCVRRQLALFMDVIEETSWFRAGAPTMMKGELPF